eukprot:TRINITY_DN78820_c0_g1_i2.p1 TRINITY_DN78820_c0_g1~~TRINITY_DN78820_c0_g1_i2.p1  ORF type:complete len:137 (-),score=31.46 TRINITY_DN78820_c0_g1_i2:125-535(-)
MPEPAPKKKASGFAAIKAGQNDLYDRLAAKRAAIAAEMEAFESMDMTIPEFIKTFRTNKAFLQKVSQTTKIPLDELQKIGNADLQTWFFDMDTDGSGTLDFQEFIEGIIKIQEHQSNPQVSSVSRKMGNLRRKATV